MIFGAASYKHCVGRVEAWLAAASAELVLFDELLQHSGDDPVLVFEPVLGDGRGRETPQAGEGEEIVIVSDEHKTNV